VLLAVTGCDRVFQLDDIRPDAPAIPIDARTGYAGAVLADQPIAYWRLGTTSQNSAIDETPNGNVGVLVGNVTSGEPSTLVDDEDAAMRFDGTDDVVTIGDRLEFPGTVAFSIEGWVKPAMHLNYSGIVTKTDESGGGSIKTGYLLYDQGQYFGFERSDGVATQSVRIGALALDVWAYVAVTFDGTRLTLYVDGVEQASSAIPVLIPATSNAFVIGARNGGQFLFYNGVIDEVAIYDHALDAAQIENHRRVALGL
jgi:hypothetical protein